MDSHDDGNLRVILTAPKQHMGAAKLQIKKFDSVSFSQQLQKYNHNLIQITRKKVEKSDERWDETGQDKIR